MPSIQKYMYQVMAVNFFKVLTLIKTQRIHSLQEYARLRANRKCQKTASSDKSGNKRL